MIFLAVELVGGILSDSLAILTDAAHMLSDFANYCIGISSICLTKLPASQKMTFGYNRVEVLGALASVFIIWILAAFLCVEAVDRLINPVPVDGLIMLIVAVIGLVCNIVMGLILIKKDTPTVEVAPPSMKSAHSEHDIFWSGPKKKDDDVVNIRAAIMNVIGDGIQSIGVIISALIIYFQPTWTIADPICTFVFTVLVMFTTVPVFKDCLIVLLEASPPDIDLMEMISDLNKLEGVQDIHSVHLWSISAEKTVFSCHMRSTNPKRATKEAIYIIKYKYNLTYPTIQVEHIENIKITADDMLHFKKE